MDAAVALAEVLQGSAFGAWARGSSFAYPAANLTHLLGLVMLVGGVGLLDLRLFGLFRAIPVASLWWVLTPIGVAGLLLMVSSGFVMFAADAGALAVSDTFRRKLMLITLALLNAGAYRLAWRGRLADWDAAAPPIARALALTSLLLWLSVAALGRLIAYT
ncbi:hypothetical protein M9M90_10945 [Phenylobacterium sp. LH3H17]|uniref:hypothetical protein n=1 Tax=Phenylobacterium sp. LH3H17 TaxID=2903901 RepID=UPI0020C9E73E|nr:hypothetical protein [Phenylobacterium sp. LH3H17]UTP37766.1 hypothetical protein M9M90_10945 [Phenylobacterium sp. LH3H17]